MCDTMTPSRVTVTAPTLNDTYTADGLPTPRLSSRHSDITQPAQLLYTANKSSL